MFGNTLLSVTSQLEREGEILYQLTELEWLPLNARIHQTVKYQWQSQNLLFILEVSLRSEIAMTWIVAHLPPINNYIPGFSFFICYMTGNKAN